MADWIVVCSSTTICHSLGVVTSLAFRMMLSPAQMGIFSALKIFISYGNYANLGISKGAVREYNVATGHGNLVEARRGLNVAFTVNTISSLCYATILLIAAGVIFWDGGGLWSHPWAIAFITAAGLTLIGRYTTFHVTILRASQKFNVTSKLSILEAVLTLTVCVMAAWRWGLAGLLGGTIVVAFGALLFVHQHAEVGLRWAWDFSIIRRLVGIGVPIMLAGAVSTLFRSLDKLMILGYFSDREFQLGCYSAALMISTPLFGFGNMLSMVTGPRFGQKYGHSKDRFTVAQLASHASELQSVAIALPAALALVIAPMVFTRMLPDYTSGLAPLKWLVPGTVALTLALPGSQYLIAVGQQRRNLVAVLAATGFGAASNLVALYYDYGLVGIAAATTAGYMAYFILVLANSLWPQMTNIRRARYAFILSIAIVPTIGTAILLQHTHPMRPMLSGVAVFMIWSLSTGAVWQLGGWKQHWRTHRQQVLSKTLEQGR